MKTIIIGSGLSSLTAAATLARAGHNVTVLEQNLTVGGVTSGYEHEGYRWDLGQLIIEGLGEDEPLGAILSELDALSRIPTRIEDRRYVFPDFDLGKPEKYQGPKWRIERLKELFPQDADGLERYWRDYLHFTALMTAARRIEHSKGLIQLSWKLRLYLRLLPFLPKLKWSAQQLMDDYFSSRELQCVFISILADFFTPPSQFPGLGVFSLNPEAVYDKRMPSKLKNGVEQLYHYSILGGSRTLVDALVAVIKEYGGTLRTSTNIEKIILESGQATGVIANGEMIKADVIIASGGAKETFFKLVGEENLPDDFIDKVRRQPLMDSIFMVHLGVHYDPLPYMGGPVAYYYGTYDIEGGIEEARKGIYHEGEKGFVVHVPSLHSPEMAPDGRHAMTIYTICPDTLSEGNWQDKKEIYADKLIEYAERHLPGLSDHIEICQILTPDEFRRITHLEHHAFGGVAPIQNTPRVPHETPIRGLWFIGAQSESGGGINNVMPAAYRVAKKISR